MFVKFTFHNCAKLAYRRKTVREANSLSSLQSVHLITKFSSDEGSQYPGDDGGLPVPDLCIPSSLSLQLEMLCVNAKKKKITEDYYR